LRKYPGYLNSSTKCIMKVKEKIENR